MNGFKFDFSKIFWGGAHRAHSPDPSPRFFSGFALGSGFASNSRYALVPSIRASPINFRLGTLVWPPQNKFLDPPLIFRRWTRTTFQVSLHGSVVKPPVKSRMKPQLYTNDFDTFQSNAYFGVEELPFSKTCT